jgi:AcrR family transcriptional regulator
MRMQTNNINNTKINIRPLAVVKTENETRAERRQQILRTAKRIFSEKGYHNACVSDIIGEAGIARGTFYLYFSNKRDIFDKLLNNLLKELDQRIRPVDLSEGQPEPLKQVSDNIRRVLELVVKEPELIQILLHHSAGLDQRSAEAVHTFYDKVLQLIEHSLAIGMQMGLVRPCSARIAALCILGTVKEILNSLTLSNEIPPQIDVVVEEILRYGLNGVSLRPEIFAAK